MRNTWTIFKKEFRLYFNSPIAYILLTVFLVFVAWWVFYFNPFFILGQADLRPFFSVLPFAFLFLVPAVAMRLWAEERKLGTVELLLTFPVRDGELVLGKYLAALGFLIFALALTFPLPLTIFLLGDPDPGPIAGSYIGSVLLAGTYLAIGSFASAITRDQIVAFIVGLTFCVGFYLVGYAAQYLPDLPASVGELFVYLGIATHFDSIARGVIDTRDLVYYVALSGLFLYATSMLLARQRQG